MSDIPHQNETNDSGSRPIALPLQLVYAPMGKKQSRAAWVVLVGVITTALTLASVYLIQIYSETNIMGLYVDFVIPFGAIIVGMAASSGYALMSWWLGVKIRKGLLCTILILLFASYFAAEYIEFVSRGPMSVPASVNTAYTGNLPRTQTLYRRLGFWEYFHRKAINWTWKEETTQAEKSEPLGMRGYFFVGLEIVGFSFSGLIIPAVVGGKPYCELCERYMRRRQIDLWPASLPPKKIPRNDAAALAEQNRLGAAKFEETNARLKRLMAAARNNDPSVFAKELSPDPAAMKAASKLPRRLQINLIDCPSCSSGRLAPVWLSGHGKKLRQTRLPKVEMSREFIGEIRSVCLK